MPVYPFPAENPHCRCKTAAQQFFCMFGHITECHYPYDCWDAGCSHILVYDLPREEALKKFSYMDDQIRQGKDPNYGMDARGQVEGWPPERISLPTVNDLREIVSQEEKPK